jgi:small GTP-binding protein
MDDDNITLKFVILGEARSGKNLVIQKYFKKKFNQGEKSTINPSFYERKVYFHGKKVILLFWDTAGQKQFTAISSVYYQDSVGALVVYDASEIETFERVKSSINDLHEVVGKDITVVIVGNKCDLVPLKKLEEQMKSIEPYCTKERYKHFYVSAKTAFNLDEAFDCLIYNSLNKYFSSTNGLATKRKGRKLEISTSKVKKEKKTYNQEDIKIKEERLQEKNFINLKLLKYYNV